MNKLRKLKKEKTRFEQDNRSTLDDVELFDQYDIDKTGPRERIAETYWELSRQVRALETDRLRALAEKWNIRIKKDWFELAYSREGKEVRALTDEAIEIIKNTVKQKRRDNIEWWITKVAAPMAGMIIALLGAVLAFLKLKS